MLLRYLLISILLAVSLKAEAQWALIDQNGGDPASSAALQINAADKGLIIPKMTVSQRDLISNPAEGLMIYQTDSTKGIYFYDGSVWKIIGKRSLINNEVASEIAVVRDVKASGVDGGTFSSGSWITRDLNDLRGDSSFITIDGINTFTLDSGIYEISATAPARDVDQHQIRLYNVTDAASEVLGISIQSEVADPASSLNGIIRIDSQKTFRIEHRCTSNGTSSFCLGTGVSWGENVYTQVRIEKL